jgi:hypothetical protein
MVVNESNVPSTNPNDGWLDSSLTLLIRNFGRSPDLAIDEI